MFIKPIVATTVALTMLSASVLPASANQTCSVSAVEAGSKIAAANNIVLDSDDAAIALNILNTANNNTLPQFTYNDDDSIRTICGMISEKTITSEKEAKAALKNIVALLGINDFDKELVFDACTTSTVNDVYSFRQICKGVKFENAFVSLVVNKETKKATYLTSTLAQVSDMDVTPTISAGVASSIMRKELGFGAKDTAELVIFSDGNGTCQLAWKAVTNNNEIECVFVDAESGKILSKVAPNYAKTNYTFKLNTTNPITKLKQFTVTVDSQSSGGQNYYRFYDAGRNIWMFGDPNESDYMMGYDYRDNGDRYVPFYFENNHMNYIIDKVTRSNNTNLAGDSSTIETGAAMYQVDRVYDFYKNIFNWKGTDNLGSAIIVNSNSSRKGSYSSGYGNFIGLDPNSNQYVSPNKVHDAAALDIVAHEYTHRISNYRVNWESTQNNAQTGALNEAYSDIMGVYAEALIKGTNVNWKFGADSYTDGKCVRDISTSHMNLVVNGQYYRYPTADEIKQQKIDVSRMEYHAGSTIISHVAYLMDYSGFAKQAAAEIWFASMDYLPKGADMANFIDCRNAVYFAACNLISKYFPNNATAQNYYLSKILMAFNTVNVKSTSVMMGDINMDGSINSFDGNLLDEYLRGKRSLNAQQLSFCDVDYNGLVDRNDYNKLMNAVYYGTTNKL